MSTALNEISRTFCRSLFVAIDRGQTQVAAFVQLQLGGGIADERRCRRNHRLGNAGVREVTPAPTIRICPASCH